MPRLTGKALVDDIANTILEDSEPERQAEEAKQEEKRRKQRKQKQRSEGAEAEARAEVSDEIIVVSESERNNLALRPVPKCRESSVIEIGGMDSVCQVSGGMKSYKCCTRCLRQQFGGHYYITRNSPEARVSIFSAFRAGNPGHSRAFPTVTFSDRHR